jgi:predicted nucleic acid-binding protein
VGSDRVRQLFRRSAEISISRISQGEVTSAIVRRMAARHIDAADGEVYLSALAEDLAILDVVEVRRPLVDAACELAREHGLRAYDSMQLAAALRVKSDVPLTFLCADEALISSALDTRRLERKSPSGTATPGLDSRPQHVRSPDTLRTSRS